MMIDRNCSISIPGYRIERDCTLLCREGRGTDVLLFYLGNYVLHVATVLGEPGASIEAQIFLAVLSLLFPFAGLYRGVRAILVQLRFGSTDLQTAARARALRMVQKGDPVRNPDDRTIFWRRITVHGQHRLPEGYKLSNVPADAQFENDEAPQPKWWQIFRIAVPPETKISNGRNIVRIVASCAQLVFSITTLNNTKGPQIKQFGYAAYGLTVIPYALMSFINIMASLLQPDYPALYIVESELLSRLRREHPDTCHVTGTVGKLKDMPNKDPGSDDSKTLNQDEKVTLKSFGFVILGLIVCLSVLAAVAKFDNGASTTSQRVWIMIWLVFNNCMGLIFGRGIEILNVFSEKGGPSLRKAMDGMALYGVPAIGGFVVVGQMIMQHGACEQIRL